MRAAVLWAHNTPLQVSLTPPPPGGSEPTKPHQHPCPEVSVLGTSGLPRGKSRAGELWEHPSGLPGGDLPLPNLFSGTPANGSNHFLSRHAIRLVPLPKHPTAARVGSGCFPLLCKDSLKPKPLISPNVAIYVCSDIAHSNKGTMKPPAQGYSSPKGLMMSPSVKIQH